MIDYQLLTINLSDLPSTEGVKPKPEFIESVRTLGILEPVLLDRTNDGYRIVNGNRRIAALRATGVTEAHIDAKVYDHLSDTLSNIFTLTLNEQRNENFATQTNAVVALRAAGMDKTEIAHATGMSKAKIDRHLHYANTPGILFDAFANGFIHATVMDQISRCQKDEQDTLAVIFSGKGRVTSTDVKTVQQASRAPALTDDTVLDVQVITDRPISYTELRESIHTLADRAASAGFGFDQVLKLLTDAPAYSLLEQAS